MSIYAVETCGIAASGNGAGTPANGGANHPGRLRVRAGGPPLLRDCQRRALQVATGVRHEQHGAAINPAAGAGGAGAAASTGLI